MNKKLTTTDASVLNGVTAGCDGVRSASVTPEQRAWNLAHGQLDGIGEAAWKLVLWNLEPEPAYGTLTQPIQRAMDENQRTRVFPLREGSKIPLLKGGCHDASGDLSTVSDMWLKYPDANIGLATGHGLVVIDVDPRHGGTVDPNLPATHTVRTANGGWHFYYTTKLDIPNSAGRLAKGVDVRGRGGHVVAPPSWIEVDGERRYWSVVDDRAPVPLPAWLADACINGVPDSTGRRPARGFRPSEEPIGEGGRNDYIARFVGWALASGLVDDELDEFVAQENQDRCVPPLDAAEVERITANIRRRERDRSTGART